MPTPDESRNVVARSPPLASSSSRASFASCPPEEDREAHAPRETRADTPQMLREIYAAHGPTSSPDATSISEAEAAAQRRRREMYEGREKGEHVEDVGAVGESPSPVGSPDVGSDSDVKLAHSMATAMLGSSEAAPQYLCFPPGRRNQPSPYSTSSFLRPGAKFRGTQQSDRQVYEVQVEIKDVDLVESFMCGYLRIQGLTDDHPTLTTFFEGEIIGPKHLFRTLHPSWNSSEKIDLQHWARFPPFRPLAKAAKSSSSFTLKNNLGREHLFMRWKEYFLVPDHRVKSISGASFEGFYYICFDQTRGEVSGIYFHAKSEKYQQLELRHVDDGGCQGAVEFR